MSSLLRLSLRLALAFVATAATVVLVDVGYGLAGRDMQKVAGMLYDQRADDAAYEWSEDPVLHFTLRRNHRSARGLPIRTDAFGARGGAPRAEGADAAAPLRILWFGASTIFGANLRDDETLPARTEVHLAAQLQVPVEVWNFGHSGYSRAQVARLARLKLEEVPEVDLVLITETNDGHSPFVRPDEPAPRALYDHIDADPLGWLAIFPEPPAFPGLGPSAGLRAHWFLLRRSAFYRAWQAARVGQLERTRGNRWTAALFERERAALVEAADRAGVPLLHVLYPHFRNLPDGQPWIDLHRDGLTRAARDPHPPARDMDAHAAYAAAQLLERGIVGTDGRVDLAGASTGTPPHQPPP